MEYVFRCLFAFAVTWVGCMLAMLIMRRSLNHYIDRLEELDAEIELLEDSLPALGAWITIDHFPGESGDYVVRCHLGDPERPFFTTAYLDVENCRYEVGTFYGATVTHWTYMPE